MAVECVSASSYGLLCHYGSLPLWALVLIALGLMVSYPYGFSSLWRFGLMSPWFYGSIAVSLHATVYFVYFLFALFVAMGRNRQNKRKREAAAAEEAKNPEVSTVAGVASSSSERPLPPMTQLDPPPLDTSFNFATQPCIGEAGQSYILNGQSKDPTPLQTQV